MRDPRLLLFGFWYLHASIVFDLSAQSADAKALCCYEQVRTKKVHARLGSTIRWWRAEEASEIRQRE